MRKILKRGLKREDIIKNKVNNIKKKMRIETKIINNPENKTKREIEERNMIKSKIKSTNNLSRVLKEKMIGLILSKLFHHKIAQPKQLIGLKVTRSQANSANFNSLLQEIFSTMWKKFVKNVTEL